MLKLLNPLWLVEQFFILRCSDAPDPPAPDPNIGIAAAEQAKLGREMFDWYKNYYETEVNPRQKKQDALLDRVVGQQLAITDSNKAQADEYYQYMLDTFRPIEKGIVDEAAAFNTEAERERLAAQAGADVSQAFAQQRAQAIRARQRTGITARPGTGAAEADQRVYDIAEAAQKAGAMTKARFQARDVGYARAIDAASLGRGLPANAATSYGIATNSGNSAMGNSGANMNSVRANAAIMGTGFEGGMSGYGAQANTLLGLHGAQLQQNQIMQNRGSPWELVGTIAGGVLGSFAGPMGSAAGAAVGNKLFGGGQNTNVPVGLASATGGRADGGVIHPEGHATSQGPGKIVGPGTDISDSIDAVNVDTGQAIKLSNNEYIIPADVVRMKGREFFDRMVQKYHTPAAKQAIQRAA